MVASGVGAEFVVAASDVLYERVAANHYRRGAIAFEAAHRLQPGLEPAVVRLDPVVRILCSVVQGVGRQLLDDVLECVGRRYQRTDNRITSCGNR